MMIDGWRQMIGFFVEMIPIIWEDV